MPDKMQTNANTELCNICGRGFGDASLPPTIMVEGREMDQEAETVSRTSSKSRIYTPGEQPAEYLVYLHSTPIYQGMTI